THSKIEFFKVIFNGLFTAVKNFYRFELAKKEMKSSLPYLTSKLFWYKKFNKKSEGKY
ncbi:glycosyltransferase family 2 protein, partial [Salmonella enterica subsp. houtenae]|nr:glycosyltransferase family 2 protein [Salmonella enterica subsp. houtenae]